MTTFSIRENFFGWGGVGGGVGGLGSGLHTTFGQVGFGGK